MLKMVSEKKSKKSKKDKVSKNKPVTNKKQIKFLKLIIGDLINKQSVPIVDLLAGVKNVNEFTIAEKLGLTINQTRNVLYKLSDYGLVSFIRKKDKRKGWYIYFWTLDSFQSLSLLKDKLQDKLKALENQLKTRKESRHYLCLTCSIEVTEETALLNEFVCSECDEVYELANNDELIVQIEKNIGKLKKEIELVSSEVVVEEGKIEKEKERKIKKADKEKLEKKLEKKRLAKIALGKLKKKDKLEESKKAKKTKDAKKDRKVSKIKKIKKASKTKKSGEKKKIKKVGDKKIKKKK